LDESRAIDVPSVQLPFEDNELTIQLQQFNAMSPSQSFGFDIYLDVVTFLTGLNET